MKQPPADGRKQVSFGVKAPNWLGDAVLATPAVRAIADCSRRGRVVILASTVSAEVFARLEGTMVFGIRRPGGGLLDSARAVYRGASLLRSLAPVLVFSFTKSFTSAATCLLGRVPRRIGFAEAAAARFYTDRIGGMTERGMHLVESYCGLVEAVGIRVADRVPRLDPTEDDLARARSVLAGHGLEERRYACLFPGARYGPAKRWGASRFGLLGDRLADRFHVNILLLGGAEDAAACGQVGEAMTRDSINLCGKLDLSSLIGVLSLCHSVVANDSGGMHLAAALDVPVVGLFFSTDPGWTGPLSARSRIIYNRTECSPCFERDCSRGNICTKTIDPDEVMAVLEELGGGAR
jgi:heptosyltransferase-2